VCFFRSCALKFFKSERRFVVATGERTRRRGAAPRVVTGSAGSLGQRVVERLAAEPSADRVLREVSGWGPDGRALSGFSELKDDGSTACGVWIYSGVYPQEGQNMARRRVKGDGWVSPEWGFSWPGNRRMLYNRASADPQGKPWSERKKYIWWDSAQGKWTGFDRPDFPETKAPDSPAKADGVGIDLHSGSDPFTLKADGRAWLFAPSGLKDGPLPTHYEPLESPVRNALYLRQDSPVARRFNRKDNPISPPGDPQYPLRGDARRARP